MTWYDPRTWFGESKSHIAKTPENDPRGNSREIPVGLLAARWQDYVDHHNGDTIAAGTRLNHLMQMDMSGPMPDEVYEVDVSSYMGDDELASLKADVRSAPITDDCEIARLTVGTVDLTEKRE